MYVCVYLFTYIYVAMVKHNIDGIITRSGVLGTYLYMYVSIYMHVHIYVRMHVCMYIHVCSITRSGVLGIYVFTSIYRRECMYVYMYVYSVCMYNMIRAIDCLSALDIGW